MAIFLGDSFSWFEAFATRHDHPFKLLCGSSLFFGSRVRIPKVATPQDPTSSTFLLEPSMPAPTLLSAPPLCHIPPPHCLPKIHGVADSNPGGGPNGPECHRINVTQMALTWPDPVTSIGFRQPQRPGRLVSLPVPQSSLLCTDRVSVICLFLAPGQGAVDIVTINSVTRWAAV